MSQNAKPQNLLRTSGGELDLFKLVSLGQAVFYIITGVWSLVSIKTFQMVTGPKYDTWLVKTVGLLVIVIGAVVGMAGLRNNRQPEIPALAVGSAASLTAIDVVYVSQKRISPIYLLDALGEVILIGLWALSYRGRGKGRTEQQA